MTEESNYLEKYKRNVIKNCIIGFLGSILFVFIVAMIGTNGKPFSEGEGGAFFKAILISLGFLLFIFIIVGFGTYKFGVKHTKTLKEINSPKGKGYASIFVIIFGLCLILQGIYSYFIMNPPVELKFVFIYIGFGIFTIIWGIYYLRKSKLNN